MIFQYRVIMEDDELRIEICGGTDRRWREVFPPFEEDEIL